MPPVDLQTAGKFPLSAAGKKPCKGRRARMVGFAGPDVDAAGGSSPLLRSVLQKKTVARAFADLGDVDKAPACMPGMNMGSVKPLPGGAVVAGGLDADDDFVPDMSAADSVFETV